MGILTTLGRRKTIDEEGNERTELPKILNVFDLTALGVGSTLGVGVYVLAGEVARNSAGPAVVLSFLIAAIASIISGLCYAEFGSRVPRAGSAYVYSYVTIGEFIAFIIGWTLILEYCIGAASVVRGLSTYVDSLLGNSMKHWSRKAMPINISFLSSYPDLFSCSVTLLFTVALAFGMKESSTVNTIFTGLNIVVIMFVIIVGSFKADIKNWFIPKDIIPAEANAGDGGFFPFGFTGVISGAAKCFYGFVGFDCIATAGEEAKNPQWSIPVSIIISLSMIFVAYFGVSTVLTMMWPYYLQNPEAPIPFVFGQIGWHGVKWFVTIGAIFGLLASMFGALFPLPRIIYAMSSDGLLFSSLGQISSRFQTPVIGTLVAGTITSIMATLFDLHHLVSMMSIGTLMAYSIVAACVTLLRYKELHASTVSVGAITVPPDEKGTIWPLLVNAQRLKKVTPMTETIVMWLLVVYYVLCIFEVTIIIHWKNQLSNGHMLPIFFGIGTAILLVTILICISLQPKSQEKLSFTVPLVPFLPGASLFINLYLMMMLDLATWIRFLVWMIVGFSIYFGYGIKRSKEGLGFRRRQGSRELQESDEHLLNDCLIDDDTNITKEDVGLLGR